MKIIAAAKKFVTDFAANAAKAQASQEAFQNALSESVEKHGLSAVSRAKDPLNPTR